jgi:hypothetical protein
LANFAAYYKTYNSVCWFPLLMRGLANAPQNLQAAFGSFTPQYTSIFNQYAKNQGHPDPGHPPVGIFDIANPDIFTTLAAVTFWIPEGMQPGTENSTAG